MEHIRDYNADVVFFTETWQTSLNNKVTAAVKNYGYVLKHNVRNHDNKSREEVLEFYVNVILMLK